MRNKCKICGYRFKSKDDVICPECFTAREDDISCGQYSEDVHSHNSYPQSEGMSFFEKENSFLEEEKREESRDKFARMAQKEAQNTNMGSFIPTQDTNNRYRQSGNIYIQNNNGSTGNKNNKKSCSCCLGIVLVMIASIAVPIVLELVDRFQEDDYSYVSNVAVSEEASDNKALGSVVYENYDNVTEYGAVGNYNVSMDYCVLYLSNYDSLYYASGNISCDKALEEDYWDEVYLRFSFTNNDTDKPIYVKSITCESKDKDGNGEAISTDEANEYPVKVESNESIPVTMYTVDNCDVFTVSVTVACDDKEETLYFNVDRTDSDENE